VDADENPETLRGPGGSSAVAVSAELVPVLHSDDLKNLLLLLLRKLTHYILGKLNN
jgi:hypothetical protein